MKQLVVFLILVLGGCANQQYPVGVNHGPEINVETNRVVVSSLISRGLKDPDSLKNLSLVSRKCFLAEPFVTDYVTDSESWCIVANYQATNSYGGYIRGHSVIYYKKSTNQLIISSKDNLAPGRSVYSMNGYFVILI